MDNKTNEFVNLSVVGSNSNVDKLDRIIELIEENNAMVKQILNSDEKENIKTETPVVENVTLETPEVPNVVAEEVTPIVETPVIEPEVKTEEVALDAVSQDNNALQYVPEEIKNDDLADAAVKAEPVVETPALNPVMEQTMQLPQEEIVQPVVETPVVAPEVEVPVVTAPVVNEQPVVEEKKEEPSIIGMDDLLKEVSAQPMVDMTPQGNDPLPTEPSRIIEPEIPTIEAPIPAPTVAPEGPSPEVPVPSETVHPTEPQMPVPTVAPEPAAPVIAPVEPELPTPAVPDSNVEMLDPAILDNAVVHADGQQRNLLVDNNEDLSKKPEAKTLVKAQ